LAWSPEARANLRYRIARALFMTNPQRNRKRIQEQDEDLVPDGAALLRTRPMRWR
jgi:hypothetical protein